MKTQSEDKMYQLCKIGLVGDYDAGGIEYTLTGGKTLPITRLSIVPPHTLPSDWFCKRANDALNAQIEDDQVWARFDDDFENVLEIL